MGFLLDNKLCCYEFPIKPHFYAYILLVLRSALLSLTLCMVLCIVN